MLRIAAVCNDTRGGIQPYGALGLGLRRAGHDVLAVAPAELAPMFVDAGIPAAQLSAGPEAVREVAIGVAERGTFATIRLTMRKRAVALGAKIRGEDGVAEAVTQFSRLREEPSRSSAGRYSIRAMTPPVRPSGLSLTSSPAGAQRARERRRVTHRLSGIRMRARGR